MVLPAGKSATMSPRQVMTGSSVSLTVTVKEELAVPATLAAVQVTLVVPMGNRWGEVITVVPIAHVTVGVGVPVAVGDVKGTDAVH
jgi:hypothetical protein